MIDIASNIHQITLMSGAVLEQRKLTLDDESFMVSTAKRRSAAALNAAVDAILQRTTIRVVDPGPYVLKEGAAFPWATVALSGDRMDALIKLRCWTYREGHLLSIDVTCDACSQPYKWQVDLQADLGRIPYPAETLAHLEDPTARCTLDSGWAVICLPNTGASEHRARRLMDEYPGRDAATVLRPRIADVFQPDGTAINRGDILEWLDGNSGRSTRWPGLTADETDQLRTALLAADGGIDLEIVAEHPACGAVTRVDLPFDRLLSPGTARAQQQGRRIPGLS